VRLKLRFVPRKIIFVRIHTTILSYAEAGLRFSIERIVIR
jgi:hypothetical protein